MKIISGMQTGADIAGVKVGKQLGLEVGGWMPAGFRTDDGPRPEYAGLYNAVCTRSPDYPMRTRMNVRDGDVTILFGNMTSPGCRLTIKYCKEQDKPFLIYGRSRDLILFLDEHLPDVINIAGNRERSNPGIEKFVTEALLKVLHI